VPQIHGGAHVEREQDRDDRGHDVSDLHVAVHARLVLVSAPPPDEIAAEVDAADERVSVDRGHHRRQEPEIEESPHDGRQDVDRERWIRGHWIL
jgi:hypothetical protein